MRQPARREKEGRDPYSAEDDLDAGDEFYEQQAEGLGAYFADSLASEIELLLVHGGIHQKLHSFHRCLSKRFPYGIFYKVADDTVFVYAVLDSRQDPERLRMRLLGK